MPNFSKKELSEQDICSKYILPALTGAGWDLQRQIREQYGFTAGGLSCAAKPFFAERKNALILFCITAATYPSQLLKPKTTNILSAPVCSKHLNMPKRLISLLSIAGMATRFLGRF